MGETITSTSNPLVKDLVRLRGRRRRDETGLFLIEGARSVERAAGAGVELVRLVVAPAVGGTPVVDAPAVTEMTAAAFERVSARQNPDGVLAVARHLDTRLDRLPPPRDGIVLIVEAVEKPGNLGAILRSAEAIGCDGVIVSDPATDVHNPNVVQASQGALFTVRLAVAAGADVLTWLERQGVELIATSPAARRKLWETDLARPVAVAVGSEADGLRPETIAAASEAALVPMAGASDSLNASVTAALVLYEAARQRQA